jgi:hypothetical protein
LPAFTGFYGVNPQDPSLTTQSIVNKTTSSMHASEHTICRTPLQVATVVHACAVPSEDKIV